VADANGKAQAKRKDEMRMTKQQTKATVVTVASAEATLAQLEQKRQRYRERGVELV
jgi:hypothetical protein